MKVEVSIDPSYTEPKAIIYTDKMTDEIAAVVKQLTNKQVHSLPAFTEKGVELISSKDIIRIYAEKKKIYLQTATGTFHVRQRLYELEEQLDRDSFVRISNGEIVNVHMIERMDISMTGTIGVLLKGNMKTYASRRYVPKIKKRFGI